MRLTKTEWNREVTGNGQQDGPSGSLTTSIRILLATLMFFMYKICVKYESDQNYTRQRKIYVCYMYVSMHLLFTLTMSLIITLLAVATYVMKR